MMNDAARFHSMPFTAFQARSKDVFIANFFASPVDTGKLVMLHSSQLTWVEKG